MAKGPGSLRDAMLKSVKKPPAPKAAPAPMRYDDAEMKRPNPQGLFNRDGFMDRVPGKANSFTKQPAATPQGTGQTWMPPADYAKMMAAKKGKK